MNQNCHVENKNPAKKHTRKTCQEETFAPPVGEKKIRKQVYTHIILSADRRASGPAKLVQLSSSIRGNFAPPRKVISSRSGIGLSSDFRPSTSVEEQRCVSNRAGKASKDQICEWYDMHFRDAVLKRTDLQSERCQWIHD